MVTIGASLSIHALMRFGIPKAQAADWTEPLPLDVPTRRALRFRSSRARATVETASDVINYSLIAKSILVDPWLVAAWLRSSPETGRHLFLINTQSYAGQWALNATTKRLVSRTRPYETVCASQPEYHPDCEQPDRYRAFYSNHAALTATGAGLACAHHQHLELYGSEAADGLACASSLALALGAGAARISADEHWLSDVIAGQVVGFALGYLLPTLVYYQSRAESPADALGQPLREPQPLLFTVHHEL